MLQYMSVPCRILPLLFILSCATRLAAQTGNLLQQPAFSGNMPLKKNYDEDAKSWYAVYTAGNIIHVYLAVTDPLQQRKIVTNGMELWIDIKEEKIRNPASFFRLLHLHKMKGPCRAISFS